MPKVYLVLLSRIELKSERIDLGSLVSILRTRLRLREDRTCVQDFILDIRVDPLKFIYESTNLTRRKSLHN